MGEEIKIWYIDSDNFENREDYIDLTFGKDIGELKKEWYNLKYEGKMELEGTDKEKTEKIYVRCQNGVGNKENPTNHRSMMVGDIVEINDKIYICRRISFEKVSWTE